MAGSLSGLGRGRTIGKGPGVPWIRFGRRARPGAPDRRAYPVHRRRHERGGTMDLRFAAALSLWTGSTSPASVAIWQALDRTGDLDRPGTARSTPLEIVARRLDPTRRGAALAVHIAAVEAALGRAHDAGIDPVSWSDVRYPPALRSLPDPPPVLWVRGNVGALIGVSVAIVGSRTASPHAVAVADRLAGDLGARGVIVVSGLARGADAAAHRGALAVGGRTVAVLGSGPDVVYPPEHKALATTIVELGAIVSELPPGTPPRPGHFPRRNRIISGLSLAVVVVEASARSGSLITARLGLEQGREVMAVPGPVLSGRNRGGHALIKDGAKLVEEVDDILQELPVDLGSSGNSVVRAQGPADTVLHVMEEGRAYDLDELISSSGLTSARLLPRLLALELGGRVARLPGGRFVRASGKVVT